MNTTATCAGCGTECEYDAEFASQGFVCPICGHPLIEQQVAEQAEPPPQCVPPPPIARDTPDRPVNRAVSPGLIVLVIMAGIALVFIYRDSYSGLTRLVVPMESIHREPRYVAAFKAAEDAIRKKLVSPASATFERSGNIAWDPEDYSKAVMALEVDSQNKYGAVIRSKWEVTLRREKVAGDDFWFGGETKCVASSDPDARIGR